MDMGYGVVLLIKEKIIINRAWLQSRVLRKCKQGFMIVEEVSIYFLGGHPYIGSPH